MQKYSLEEKPDFIKNAKVLVALPTGNQRGIIVGKASTNIIDIWIVDFGANISELYQFNCCVVPHTLIYKESET